MLVSTHAIRIEVNPRSLDRAGHIAMLDRAFPGHWSRPTYDWYIARSFHDVESETLAVSDGGRILSVMTVCYRQVGPDPGCPIDVCVLSSAATIPAEQRKGHYGRLLEAARERARMKGYAALLGFVTRDNVSGRGLAERGARAIPSFYVVSASGAGPRSRSPVRGAAPQAPPRPASHWIGHLQRESCRTAGIRFLYTRGDDWRRQFLERPSPVRLLRLAHDSLALIETVCGTDRLQWLAAPREKIAASIACLARASAAAGRRFFLYTLDPVIAACARRAGLGIRPGYLMLWPTGHAPDAWRAIATGSWTVQSGDRL
jgi:GNAT superfamily N-acetyltransferase